jgi:small ligand-binding sensory domain FIST
LISIRADRSEALLAHLQVDYPQASIIGRVSEASSRAILVK